MQVMVLEEEPALRSRAAAALAGTGFDVVCTGNVAVARDHARQGVDILVLGERVGGRLVHDVALLAEWRNPLLAAFLLTDRTGPDVDELFALLPSLQAVLGRATPPATIAQLTLGAASAETAAERLARRWHEAGSDGDDAPHADPGQPDEAPAEAASDDKAPVDAAPLPSFRACRARPMAAPTDAVATGAPPAVAGRRLHLA